MKQKLWLAGIASVALGGAWSGFGGAPSAANEPSCPDFWIPPGSSQPECLEIFRPAPEEPVAPEMPDAEATAPNAESEAESDADPAEAATDPNAADEPSETEATPDAPEPGAAETEEASDPEPEWTFAIRRRDGLQFFLDTASVVAAEDNPDSRTFIFRQDASEVPNPDSFDFLLRDQVTTVSCTQANFSHSDTIVLARDGTVREFISAAQGVASEEADPGFFAVLQAACDLDLAAEAEAEMPTPETPE